MTYAQIQDEFIRTALEGPVQNVSRAALSSILDDCSSMVIKDAQDESVSIDVLTHRETMLELASEHYQQHNHGSCHSYLRKYFEV